MKYYTKYAKITTISGCDFSTGAANYFSNSSYRTHKMKYYTKYAKLMSVTGTVFSDINTGHDYYHDSDYLKLKQRQYMSGYFSAAYHTNRNYISPEPLHAVKPGCTNGTLSDKLADQLCGEKEELENWQYFVFNNDLPLFINITLNYDQCNKSEKYLPWLTDKRYTDEEIYDKLKFTEEEINLINKTLQKYERYSTWFRLYSNGE